MILWKWYMGKGWVLVQSFLHLLQSSSCSNTPQLCLHLFQSYSSDLFIPHVYFLQVLIYFISFHLLYYFSYRFCSWGLYLQYKIVVLFQSNILFLYFFVVATCFHDFFMFLCFHAVFYFFPCFLLFFLFLYFNHFFCKLLILGVYICYIFAGSALTSQKIVTLVLHHRGVLQ